MHMLSSCVCGTIYPEFDEPICVASPVSSPKRSKRKDGRNKNPYSTRGLEEFSELLAVLDEKRQKLYSQMSPHDISIVRFVHSKTNDFVPIVVKLKNNKKDQKHNNKSQELNNKVVKARKSTENLPIESTKEPHLEEKKQTHLVSEKKEANKKKISWNLQNLEKVKPWFYLPMIMILILVSLALFGRSVAILCTCILWYVIPTLKENRLSENPRWSMKKKDYVRGLTEKNMVVTKRKDFDRGFSEKKMEVNEGIKKKDYVRRWSEKIVATDPLSPTNEDSEASKNKTQGKHSHKKSW